LAQKKFVRAHVRRVAARSPRDVSPSARDVFKRGALKAEPKRVGVHHSSSARPPHSRPRQLLHTESAASQK